MFIQLDFESHLPIYEQIKNQIIIGMAKKELLPNDKLPSVRGLASDIGVNLHTVNKAYQQLKQEGFLLIHRQKGVVIHPDGPPQADSLYKKGLTDHLAPIVATSLLKGMKRTDFEEIMETIYHNLLEGDVNDD